MFAGRGVAAVGAHHQVGPVLARPVVRTGADTHHPAILAQEVAHGDAACETEAGVLAGLVGQQLQQRGLRHRTDLPAAEPLGVRPDDSSAARVDLDEVHLGVRQAVELLTKSHLPEGVDAAPLHALAAEGAGEVVVCLQHRDPHVTPRQQVGQRHAGRARPHDDHPARLHRHACSFQGNEQIFRRDHHPNE